MGGRKNKQMMKLIKAFRFAFNGFKICLSSEINFRIHVVAAIAAAAAGICLHITKSEWLLIKKIPGLHNRASLL
jgi:diacylglycerol kinase